MRFTHDRDHRHTTSRSNGFRLEPSSQSIFPFLGYSREHIGQTWYSGKIVLLCPFLAERIDIRWLFCRGGFVLCDEVADYC